MNTQSRNSFALSTSVSACLVKGVFLLLASLSASGQVGTAVRQLPFDFHPGDLIEVRIQVTPQPGTTNWTVREVYPNRWDFISATNASSVDEFSGELVFGPFTNDTATTLVYDIASIQGLTNSVTFCGDVYFDVSTNAIAGTTNLPARNEWLFTGPQVLDSGSPISGVAYGAGRWLVSTFGWVTTIESGGRLTYPRSVGFHGDSYSRLSYVGGLFLLFGAGGGAPLMDISDDGLSWKAAQGEAGAPHPYPFDDSAGQVESVAYGNGFYVAAANQYYYSDENEIQGALFRSTNGYNWRRELRLGNPGRRINAVAFGNGLFMAAADQGTLLTSTNGSDWTVIQPLLVIGDPAAGTTNSVWMNRSLRGICYGPAGWIIPTTDSTGTAQTLSSTNGENWTELTGPSSPNDHLWQSFYADGKYWFSTVGSCYATSDGTSWARNPSLSPTPPVGPVSRGPDGVSPQYLAAGVAPGTTVSSSNGVTWVVTALDGQNGSGTLRWPRYLSAATLNNACVIGGQGTAPVASGGQDFPYDRYYNGILYAWIPQLSASVLSVRDAGGNWSNVHQDPIVAYGDMLPTPNGLLAAGAFSSLSPTGLRVDLLAGTNYSVAVSTLLANQTRSVSPQYWEYVAPSYLGPATVNASLAATPYGYELFAESYNYYSLNEIGWGHFTSPDGTNWVRRAPGLNDATSFPAIRGLAWGAGRFVAVSEGSSPAIITNLTSPNRIYTSTNGEAYTPVDLTGLVPDLGGEGLTGVAFANGRFMAIGNAGRILSSTDGLEWKTVRDSDAHRWNRVRCLNGTWAAVGNAGWVGFSTDGQNWISKTSGTQSDLTDITTQNGGYLMVGSHAMVLVSLPVPSPTILVESLLKLPGAGLQFTVNGQPDKVLDIQSSTDLVNWTSLFFRTNSTGRVLVADPAPDHDRQFYRAVQQP